MSKLYVDEIFGKTGTTTKLTQCHFHGRLASTQTIARASTVKVVGMTTDKIDSHNSFDGTTFTVPSGQEGIYLVTANVFFDFSNAGNDGEAVEFYFKKNGTEVYRFGQSFNTGGKHMQQIIEAGVGILSLAAGDILELYVYMVDDSASGTLRLFGGSEYGTGFGAVRIGAA
jgi:hypothetical protein